MVFPDGTPESTMALAQERGLTFPILSDPERTLFNRWNPAGGTPNTTILGRGVRVEQIEGGWHRQMLEDFLAGQ